jgi:hypothetical protein
MDSKSILAASAALFLSVSLGKAQVFSTGAVLGDSDVQNIGSVVYAYNMDFANSTTINGITFTGINPLSTTSPDFSLTNEGSLDGTGGGNLPNGSDANYSAALQTLVAEGTGGNFILVLNGLTIGQSYSFEAIFDANINDARSQALEDITNSNPGPLSATVTAGGDQGFPLGSVLNPNPTGAQFIIDNFTATGSTETLVAQFGGGAGAQMSGFVLEATTVPEPSTWALMGLGAMGLAFLARRKALHS